MHDGTRLWGSETTKRLLERPRESCHQRAWETSETPGSRTAVEPRIPRLHTEEYRGPRMDWTGLDDWTGLAMPGSPDVVLADKTWHPRTHLTMSESPSPSRRQTHTSRMPCWCYCTVPSNTSPLYVCAATPSTSHGLCHGPRRRWVRTLMISRTRMYSYSVHAHPGKKSMGDRLAAA